MDADYENYRLNTEEVTGTALPAAVLPVAPAEDEKVIDMAIGQDTGAPKGIHFTAGVKGEAGANGNYWYGKDGIPVTLPEDTSMIGEDGEKVVNGFFVGKSEEAFYINQSGIYYGPYQVVYQKDTSKIPLSRNKFFI